MKHVGRRFIVILVASIDSIVHFTRIHSSFVAGISRRLLNPARTLTGLTSSLRSNGLSRRRITTSTHRIHSDYDGLGRVISSLLLLVHTRRPVAPSSTGQLGIVRRLETATTQLRPRTTRTNIRLGVGNSSSLIVGNRTSRVSDTIAGLVRGTVNCSGRGNIIDISTSGSGSNSHTIVHIVSRNANVTGGSRTHVFRQFCQNIRRDGHATSNINLNLTVIGRITLARRNSIAM